MANEKFGVKPAENIRVRVTFLDELLGSAPKDPEIYKKFIASKAPDAQTREEEIASIGVDDVIEKGSTGFLRDSKNNPILKPHQIKGFFKEACRFSKEIEGSRSKDLTAFVKKIDGLIFVGPSRLKLEFGDEIRHCQRPLRASTMQGERISLANSETVPPGTTVEFTVCAQNGAYAPLVREWLDYGYWKGLGQWRNSGKGRFVWEELDESGNTIGGNKNEHIDELEDEVSEYFALLDRQSA